jgi:two-component system, OmpR family, phosphate regulon response regulator PhoB
VAFVLIVDANPAHARRASDVLIASGHSCGWVPDAERAVALLRWRAPELILLDQAIPGADGGTLPHRLRRAAAAEDLPIILLTSDSAGHSAVSGAILDEIRKPFDPGFLAWRIGHALESRLAGQSGHNVPAPLAEPGEAKPELRSVA